MIKVYNHYYLGEYIMVNKKFIFLFVFLLISVLCVFPQASININEYGAYFIDNGELKIIPTTFHLIRVIPWRNYIIFSGWGAEYFLYNIENGATSEFLLPSDVPPYLSHLYKDWRGFFPLRSSNNNLIFYYNRTEYEFNPETLETVRKYVWGRNENVFDVHTYLKDENNKIITTWKTREYLFEEERRGHGYRLFFNDTEYIDILYSPNIELLNDTSIISISNIKKQFVFIINNTRDTDR
jgi:hypothetical protein